MAWLNGWKHRTGTPAGLSTPNALVSNLLPHGLPLGWMPLLSILSSIQRAPEIHLLPLPGSLLGLAIGWQLPLTFLFLSRAQTKGGTGHLSLYGFSSSPEKYEVCSVPCQAFARALPLPGTPLPLPSTRPPLFPTCNPCSGALPTGSPSPLNPHHSR